MGRNGLWGRHVAATPSCIVLGVCAQVPLRDRHATSHTCSTRSGGDQKRVMRATRGSVAAARSKSPGIDHHVALSFSGDFSLVALAVDHLESTQDDSTASLPGMWISNPERFGGSSQLFDSLRCSATTFAAASGCVKASGGAQADIHLPKWTPACPADQSIAPRRMAHDRRSPSPMSLRVASRVLGQRRVFRRGSDPLTRASAIPSERGPFRRGLRQACVASGCIGGWFPKRSEAKRTERLPPPGLRTDALSDFGGT